MPLLLIEAGLALLLAYLIGVCLGCFLRWATLTFTRTKARRCDQISAQKSCNDPSDTELARTSVADNFILSDTEVPASTHPETTDIATRKGARQNEHMMFWPVAVNYESLNYEDVRIVSASIVYSDHQKMQAMHSSLPDRHNNWGRNDTITTHSVILETTSPISGYSTDRPAITTTDFVDGLGNDLTCIQGITPEIARMLNNQGIRHYGQIAALQNEDIERLNRLLGTTDRIQHENWIGQADTLGRRKIITAPTIAASARVVINRDNFRRIRGINEQIEAKLNHFGFTTYAQIANWTQSDIERVSGHLNFQGRIERENWIEQAKILSLGGHTEFSQLFDRGEFQNTFDIETDVI